MSDSLLQHAFEKTGWHMEQIVALFQPGVKIAVMVRSPGFPDRDFMMTDDAIPELRAMLDRREPPTDAAPGIIAALRDCMELAWEDTRDVRMDNTVLFSHSWDSFGWDILRQEIRSPAASFAVWPDRTAHGRKWSVYGGPDGSMWFQRFDSEREAKDCAIDELARHAPNHPAVRARIALAKVGK